MKNIRNFYLKFFPFLVVKFSIYLNRRVFVMWSERVLFNMICAFAVLICPKNSFHIARPLCDQNKPCPKNSFDIARPIRDQNKQCPKNSFDIARPIRDQNKPRSACISIQTSLWKHAYSNILKILQPKTEFFLIKNLDIFHYSVQNIDCGYSLEPPQQGGSNEYLQSMFLSRNKKNNVYPCKPQFYYIKVGFKGVKII